LARKAQAANEVQQAIVTENIPTSNAVSLQQSDGNAMGNKEHQDQNPGVMTNQDNTTTTIASNTIDVSSTSYTSELKSKETTQVPECETGILIKITN